MASIFDMFRGTPQQAPAGAPPAGGAAQGAPTGATPPGAAPNGWVPPNTNNQQGAPNSVTPGTSGNASGAPGQSSGAPVDDWSKMWETADKSSKAAPTATTLFDIKPEQIQAAAKNMNFASNLNQETVQKALQGDVASFMEVINQVGQQVYAQTSYSGMRLMDAGINKFGKNFSDNELPKHFQSYTADHALRNANPVFADKKYAPMLDTFKQALIQANPSSSPQEIQATAERFLESMITDAKKVSASSGNNQNNGSRTGNATGSDLVVKDQAGNDDWSQYFAPMDSSGQAPRGNFG